MTPEQAREYATRIRLGERCRFRSNGIAHTYTLEDGTPLICARPVTGWLDGPMWLLVPDGFSLAEYEGDAGYRHYPYDIASGSIAMILGLLDERANAP
jgi:hypothetical protein